MEGSGAMRSIDNLREYVLTAPSICSTTRANLVGYVDSIDAEHQKVLDEWKVTASPVVKFLIVCLAAAAIVWFTR